MQAQLASSAMSGISSAIGNFHQEIIGSIAGFENHDAGYDVECPSRQLLAEIKNKHNTMNSTTRDRVLDNLVTAVAQKKKKK